MAVATLASRVAGFGRLVVLASALGLGGRLLDSYNVANTLPNAVYEPVAETNLQPQSVGGSPPGRVTRCSWSGTATTYPPTSTTLRSRCSAIAWA